MKKNIMKKWVKALRSGEYLQGTGYLAQEDNIGNYRFCCLGVLCNIMQEEKGGVRITDYAFNFFGKKVYSYDGDDSVLKDKVKKWSGIKNGVGKFKYKNNRTGFLANLNDRGKTFKQIADIIEKNYEAL